MTLEELKRRKGWKKAVIGFTESSFNLSYTEEERSYEIQSDAKYFNDGLIGNSLFGNCIDGKDNGVRLDLYIHDLECPWEIEYCYIVE